MTQTNSCFMLISCLMFLSLNQGQEGQAELPKARISCPEGTNACGSYCYYFNEDLEIWVDADAEVAFVASLIEESGTKDGNVWIGLYDPHRVSLLHLLPSDYQVPEGRWRSDVWLLKHQFLPYYELPLALEQWVPGLLQILGHWSPKLCQYCLLC
ncbi:lithostathine-1-alpha-like isoform X2 [Macaca mulatta]